MPDRFARTFGATAILATIVAAGIVQFANSDRPDAVIADGAPSVTETIETTSTLDQTTNGDSADPFVYRLGILQGLSTENFWSYNATSTSVWDAYLLAPTKASLYKLDGSSLKLESELASELPSPTWDAEGWKVEIALRDDLAWSDGQAMTSADFVFTFRTVRALNLGGNWARSFPSSVISVTAVDPHHITIRFTGRPGLEVWPYAIGTVPVMAEHFWAGSVDSIESASALFDIDGSQDVSGGPLDLVQVEDDHVVSRPNPGYPDAGSNIVEYWLYESEEAMAEALRTGEIHTLLTPKGITDENASLLGEAAGIRTVATHTFGVRYLGFNLDRTPMDTIEFREAVAYLLDREEMAREFAPLSVATGTLMAPANTFWFDSAKSDEITNRWEGTKKGRLSLALSGLRSVGYTWTVEPSVKNGVIVAGEGLLVNGTEPVPLTILTPGDIYDPARPRYAAEIATQIELLGYSVIPIETDFSTVVDLAFTPDENGDRHYDMVLLGWSLGNPAYPSFYADLFGEHGIANNTGYHKPKMEKLINLFHLAQTAEEARAIVWEMEALIARDLPYLPLYSAQIIEAYRSDLIDLDIDGILGGIHASLGGYEFVTPKN